VTETAIETAIAGGGAAGTAAAAAAAAAAAGTREDAAAAAAERGGGDGTLRAAMRWRRGMTRLSRRASVRHSSLLLLAGAMDPAMSPDTQPSCWGVDSDKLAEAMSLLLPLLPLDCRARAACVCRAWCATAARPDMWEELSFEHCAVRITDATLAALCARAGAALRTLRLDTRACLHVTGVGVLNALRGCAGVQHLFLPEVELRLEEIDRLDAMCPMLQHSAFTARVTVQEAAAVLMAHPGIAGLNCSCDGTNTGLAELTAHLRLNATVKRLELRYRAFGDAVGTQLAECLSVNTTLTSLDLASNGGRGSAGGATRLAECLRVNTTLKSLTLYKIWIEDEGAVQLAECLRANTTLTSLELKSPDFAHDGGIISRSGRRALEEACPPQCTLRFLL